MFAVFIKDIFAATRWANAARDYLAAGHGRSRITIPQALKEETT